MPKWQNGYEEEPSRPPPEHVRHELERILGSPKFKSTARRRKLLKYLVEEMLAGRDHELKGYTIATLVFGRDESFDPQTDPVVRLEARRLRHDLDSYYVSAGRGNPLRISIPKGKYAPAIEWLEDHADAEQGSSAGVGAVADAIPQATVIKAAVRPGLSRRALTVVVTVVMLLVAIVGVFVSHRFGTGKGETDFRGPALAVLPFTTPTGNPDLALLGVGIADQVVAGISRFADLRLYLPPGDAKGPAASDAIEMGNRLGLTYVVDGSVGSDAGSATLRVSARLLEVQTHRILWIGTYDRTYSVSSLFAVQDEIAASVASTLGQPYGVIRTDESAKLAERIAPSMSSYECVLRAYSYRRTFAGELLKPAIACLEAAVQRDPDYAEAWAMLGWLQMFEGLFGPPDGIREAAYERALATVSHAVALDRNNISALKAMASIHHFMGNYSESDRIQRQALALNPNDPDTLAQLGWRLAARGRSDEGIPYLREAIRRTVDPPGWYYHLVAIDHYLHGRYTEMLEAAQKSTIDGSGPSWSFVAIAEGALGNDREAGEALVKMAHRSPLLSRDPAAAYRRYQLVDSMVDALVSGLHKAGWKEPAGDGKSE